MSTKALISNHFPSLAFKFIHVLTKACLCISKVSACIVSSMLSVTRTQQHITAAFAKDTRPFALDRTVCCYKAVATFKLQVLTTSCHITISNPYRSNIYQCNFLNSIKLNIFKEKKTAHDIHTIRSNVKWNDDIQSSLCLN